MGEIAFVSEDSDEITCGHPSEGERYVMVTSFARLVNRTPAPVRVRCCESCYALVGAGGELEDQGRFLTTAQ